MADPQSLIPEVTDEDIAWVCRVMNLRDLDQPRQEFLRERGTRDVAACPGSGKTTLVVAKLAIMARKWPHGTKGICVLSHTNAAREEIQRLLSGTVVGARLLAYPHFIDTIHGFVNRFLAIPWLKSRGCPSPTVDDDVTSAYRRSAVGSDYWKVQKFLERKYSGFDRIRIRDRTLNFCLGRKDFPAGRDTETHRIARHAVQASYNAGYFCYEEMFVWARALLEDCPAVSTWLQHRFPLVVIDEVQDTSGLQFDLLNTVFPRMCAQIALQRVGDPNQEIYDNDSGEHEPAHGFPDHATCLKIAKSFRFGSQIAALASPFAVDAVGPEGLQGSGPRTVGDAQECCGHAIFVFPKDGIRGVLDAYGLHVLSNFSDDALGNGDVTAVGAVHRDANDVGVDHKHFPKTVPHYWGGYTAEVARREPHPRRLVQYFRVAQALVRDKRDLSPGVEQLASGMVQLARLTGGAGLLGRVAARHRAVVEALNTKPKARNAYHRLLRAFLIEGEILTRACWDKWQVDIHTIATALNDSVAAPDAAREFMTWDERISSLTESVANSTHNAEPNIYRVGDGSGRSVDIRLGSVHSIKGQTHLATLLLSTYWKEHSSERMLPWLLGKRVNLDDAGKEDRTRLLQTYVAMTRPSHLVCLAIPRFVLGDDEATLTGRVATLKERGWHVAHVVDGKAQWVR
jgi:DNA helicase-2/ATP-dependent DNA helicase PcrA